MSEHVPKELDLFQAPEQLLAISDTYYERVPTKTSLPSNGHPSALDFSANIDRLRYSSLYDSFIALQLKLVKADMSNIPAAPRVAFVQNMLYSMFRSVECWINNIKCSTNDQNMHYNSFLRSFLAPENIQKTELNLAGYYPDSYSTLLVSRQNDPEDRSSDRSPSLKERSLVTAESRIVHLMGRINAPPHLSKKLYLPQLKFDYRFIFESDDFFLLQPEEDTEKYTVVIVGADIWLKRVNVNPSLAMAHSQMLNSKAAIYPINDLIDTRVLDIPAGSLNFKFPNCYVGGNIPRLLVIALVNSKAKNGSRQLNPYLFDTAKLEEIRCYVGSKVYPTIPYKLDPSRFSTETSILDFYNAVRSNDNRLPIALTRETHTGGLFLLAFSLARDDKSFAEYQNASFQSVNLSIEGTVSEATDTNYSIIVWGMFQTMLKINKFMEPLIGW